VVRTAALEQELSEFDARYESTAYPTEFLWGPGTYGEAAAWLETAGPLSDQPAYLDRLFAIRRDGGKVYLPNRPEILLGLPAEHRAGQWDLVRADFPMDAFSHVRHLQRGEGCPDMDFGGCPVEDVAAGTWATAVEAAKQHVPNLQPAAYSTARVPRHRSYPDDVGY
jgi:hypothetical protein